MKRDFPVSGFSMLGLYKDLVQEGAPSWAWYRIYALRRMPPSSMLRYSATC